MSAATPEPGTPGTPSADVSTAPGCLILIGIAFVIGYSIWGPEDKDSDDGPNPSDSNTSSLSPADIGFLASLGNEYEDYADEELIDLAQEVCSTLDAGNTWSDVSVMFTDRGWSAYEGGYLAGAAVGSYCPQHEDKIN